MFFKFEPKQPKLPIPNIRELFLPYTSFAAYAIVNHFFSFAVVARVIGEGVGSVFTTTFFGVAFQSIQCIEHVVRGEDLYGEEILNFSSATDGSREKIKKRS